MDHLASAGEMQVHLKLGGALWKFWYQRGHIREGLRRLGVALDADRSPTAARARALNGAGGLMGEYGDNAAAHRFGARRGDGRRPRDEHSRRRRAGDRHNWLSSPTLDHRVSLETA